MIIKKEKEKLEKDILNDICQYLQENKFFFWRSNNIPVFGMNNGGKMTFRSMPKFSMKGVPDIIVIESGQFIGIEVKRPLAKLRPDQHIFCALCERQGGKYFVAHSREEVEKYFDLLFDSPLNIKE